MNAGELRHTIIFQKISADTDVWGNYYTCRAKANTSGGQEYAAAGTELSSSDVIFTVRYCSELADLFLRTQYYRILFIGATFDIQKVDDYMFRHQWLIVKAVGRMQ